MLLVGFSLLFLISVSGIFWKFYTENTLAAPAEGGTLVVGAVATMDQNFVLNPLLVKANKKATSVESDISSLIFAGLMEFDAETGQINDQLATHTLSANKRTYTFTLKDNLTWHDGTPLTANDVLFTYQTLIQNPDFPNALLKQAFDGVLIEKVDDKTVKFTIPKAYKFFLTNFTVGLLPEHLLKDTPAANLGTDTFNLNPIGAGPYRFKTITPDENSPITTINMEAFPEYALGKPKISLIDFELFPSEDLLSRNLSDLDALRPKLKNQYADIAKNDDFQVLDFTIPQYVAVFINMDSPKVGGDAKKKIRIALQLATNKDEILGNVPGKRIDTPLLETNTGEWLYEFSTEKAAGALKDSGWYLPESPELKPPVVQPPVVTPPVTTTTPPATTQAVDLKYVYEPSKKSVFWTTTGSTYLVGAIPAGTTGVRVNGYRLQLFNAANGRFSYKIDTKIGTMKKGKNTYRIEFLNSTGGKIDEETATINLVDSEDQIPKEIPPVATPEPTIVTPPAVETPEAPAADVPDKTIRRSKSGALLELNLVTISTPEFYPQVAEVLKKQWEQAGIKLNVEVLDQEAFIEKALVKKDYDLLLYGQNLGYNLDPYPFWHFSQADEGSNLSKYKSFQAGVLLEEIRGLHDDALRTQRLKELQEILKNDIPAVFLFSPTYSLPISTKIQNIKIDHIALFPDEFSDIEKWYIRESRNFTEGKGWLSFFSWFASSTKHSFTF